MTTRHRSEAKGPYKPVGAGSIPAGGTEQRQPHRPETTSEFVQRIASEPRYDDDDLRGFALEAQLQHDPTQQDGNPYKRCEHCHYTRHPCDVYDLATAVLALLDRVGTDQ